MVPTKLWLAQFFFDRKLQKPTGRPLHSYQVTQMEFEGLQRALSTSRDQAEHPLHRKIWAACFCLFVAESYRRKYDPALGWAWDSFECELGCNFSQPQHGDLVELGLKGFWSRPIRNQSGRRDLLGSLFVEGGLPWPLVQAQSHGFGRAVLCGIRCYFKDRACGRPLTGRMAEFDRYFPVSFRNIETHQLLAGIVEQLMFLVEKHPLHGARDPAALLDERDPDWKMAFPIPLDEANARALLNDWLSDADRQRGRRAEEVKHAQAYVCVHRLLGDDPSAVQVASELHLPEYGMISLDGRVLSSTRLEMGCYEGDRLLQRMGVLYGERSGDDGIRFKFPHSVVTVERRDPSSAITLRVFDSGEPIHSFHFDDAALELIDAPLVFELRDDLWWFVASVSCRIGGDAALVRLPAGFDLQSEAQESLRSSDPEARWVRLSGDAVISSEDEEIAVTFGYQETQQHTLHGTTLFEDALPTLVFRGWPKLVPPPGEDMPALPLIHRFNGAQAASFRGRDRYGDIRYCLTSASGKTILRRRFGVVPRDFAVALHPESATLPARVLVRSQHHFRLAVEAGSFRSQVVHRGGESKIELPRLSDEPPMGLSLLVSDTQSGDPVRLYYPYPFEGVRVVDANGKRFHGGGLTLDQILGMQATLSSPAPQGQTFRIVMELEGGQGTNPSQYVALRVGQKPASIRLYSFLDDIINLLGALPSQDGCVRLTIETTRPLIQFSIRRYGYLLKSGETSEIRFVSGTDRIAPEANVSVSAMRLDDPKQMPLALPQRHTEGLPTGEFEIPAALNENGPWLVFPPADSPKIFRPVVHTGRLLDQDDASGPVYSLHHAARLFHPVHRPNVIEEQIAKMANDLFHSGWDYLSDLRQNYKHLALSTFETWRSLTRNHRALALATLRLEMDPTFCGRIRDELAVIWEAVPLPTWSDAYRAYATWLSSEGLPIVHLDRVLESARHTLREVVSGFEDLGDYLQTGKPSQLRTVAPELVLPDWYQDLRRMHAECSHWPTQLGDELRNWVADQALSPEITELSKIRHTDAVTYLPIFMSFVTAGYVPLTSDRINERTLKHAVRHLSNFDRAGWYAPVHALMVCYHLQADTRPTRMP